MTDFEEHTQTAFGVTVLQVALTLKIKNLQVLKFLPKSLRCGTAAEHQTGEQCIKQDRIKELKYFIKTDK